MVPCATDAKVGACAEPMGRCVLRPEKEADPFAGWREVAAAPCVWWFDVVARETKSSMYRATM